MTDPDRIERDGTCPRADDGVHELDWRRGTDPAGEWRYAVCVACSGATRRVYTRRYRLD